MRFHGTVLLVLCRTVGDNEHVGCKCMRGTHGIPWDSPTYDNGTGWTHRMQVYGRYPWDSMGQDKHVECKYMGGTHGIPWDSPACLMQESRMGQRHWRVEKREQYPTRDFIGQSYLLPVVQWESYIGQGILTVNLDMACIWLYSSRVSRVHTVYRVHFESTDRIHGVEIQSRSCKVYTQGARTCTYPIQGYI